MKKLYYLVSIALCLSISSILNAQDTVKHDFNDGNFYPYVVPKSDQEARVKIINEQLQTHWDHDLYDGTNSGRKAQIKQAAGDHTDEELQFTQHIWMGFSLKIHSDYMKDNTNTNAGLMQIWGHNGDSGAENHMCMLKFDGRNGGALVWQHRYNSVANKAHYLVYPNFPRDEFLDVVMHVQLAEKNEGIVQVWVDGELLLDKIDQTIGWGDQDASGMINGTYCFGTSIGQYNFFENAGYDDAYDGDDHLFDGHLEGETRTVTYDDVALYNGADGYDVVNPGNSDDKSEVETTTTTTTTTEGNLVHITKRNATGYAIDGGTGGENGQSVTLSSVNTSDEGQLWTEIDRGNGYYSYEKYGTNYSLDGDSGGANNQLVYLWETNDTNQNQQWEKQDQGDGGYKLIKRNATGYTINGGSGAVEGRNITLWNSSVNSQNLEWYITPVSYGVTTRIEAEDYDGMSGIQTETSTESGDNVGYINNGDWLRFDDVNLSGLSNMDVRVASNFTGGTIEIRTGSISGTLLGSISITNTGGHQKWITENTSLSNVTGTQDVYLVFAGGDGYLFNVNWIEFNNSATTGNKDVVTTIAEIAEVVIYPNPIETTTIIQGAANTIVHVYDMNGRVMLTKNITNDIESMDLTELSAGIYYAQVNGLENNLVIKMIKK